MTTTKLTDKPASGASVVIRALREQGVDTIFGYPGGAVLPLYDELFQQNAIRHILVRHEQGALHAAEGYARATGKVGVALVTSGPGLTNAVTGLADAMLDSIPVVCLSGQVPTRLIGTDAFQEVDAVGITRACTKHNWLVKDPDLMARTIHEAFDLARMGRPGPVVVDMPKDVQVADAIYEGASASRYSAVVREPVRPDPDAIAKAVALMREARRPVIYVGGGVVNAGEEASVALAALADTLKWPLTATLMGLGAYPADAPSWLGMLGMHGSLEANMAMHGCDVMLAVGARFDDRITGRLDAFSPESRKIQIDIDPSSINKNVAIEVPIVADCAEGLRALLAAWRATSPPEQARLAPWQAQIEAWRARDSFSYAPGDGKIIKPQLAIDRLYAHTQDRPHVIVSTEVGQHQMWAAQRWRFNKPRRWLTSGGLGTMGYGLPAAIGAQLAYPDALVIDIAGEASILMNMQELSTAVQHRAGVKVFILNNEYMGMVRQWQELMHGGRYAHSYTASLPDFVKLAEAYGATGIRVDSPDDLDEAIQTMLNTEGPVLFDCHIDKEENCFPMIPSGAAHNEMILAADAAVTARGQEMV